LLAVAAAFIMGTSLSEEMSTKSLLLSGVIWGALLLLRMEFWRGTMVGERGFEPPDPLVPNQIHSFVEICRILPFSID
jgi:hypothetical protein